jgi:hypothetical protein
MREHPVFEGKSLFRPVTQCAHSDFSLVKAQRRLDINAVVTLPRSEPVATLLDEGASTSSHLIKRADSRHQTRKSGPAVHQWVLYVLVRNGK